MTDGQFKALKARLNGVIKRVYADLQQFHDNEGWLHMRLTEQMFYVNLAPRNGNNKQFDLLYNGKDLAHTNLMAATEKMRKKIDNHFKTYQRITKSGLLLCKHDNRNAPGPACDFINHAVHAYGCLMGAKHFVIEFNRRTETLCDSTVFTMVNTRSEALRLINAPAVPFDDSNLKAERV
jgi:hypothetical protein